MKKYNVSIFDISNPKKTIKKIVIMAESNNDAIDKANVRAEELYPKITRYIEIGTSEPIS